MLTKRVCKACVNAMAGKAVYGFRDEGAAAKWRGWDDHDEKRWRKGIVMCRVMHEFHALETSRKEAPPKWCKYACEQVVSEKPC